jgi:hypothetical protein
MSSKDRLDKVLAVAINPGAYEQEAVAALHKARELVRRDPALAFDLPSMSNIEPLHEATFETTISGVSEFWLPILLNNMSDRAYALRLRSKFMWDFTAPTAVHVICDGEETACDAFERHLHLIVEYMHSGDDRASRG